MNSKHKRHFRQSKHGIISGWGVATAQESLWQRRPSLSGSGSLQFGGCHCHLTANRTQRLKEPGIQGILCQIVSPIYNWETAPRKSQQYDDLNKSWNETIPTEKPAWRNLTRSHSQIELQVVNAEWGSVRSRDELLIGCLIPRGQF